MGEKGGISTTTYNRRIEIFVCVVRTYVRPCVSQASERKREIIRDHYLLQHIIGGLRFSWALYVRTSVCVTGIRKKVRENTRPLSTTTYNRRIEIFVCVVRTYVRPCVSQASERKRERIRDHYLLQHIIGGLRFSWALYVRTSVCVTGIRKKVRENTRPLSTTTYNRRIEIFVYVANVSLRKVNEILSTQIDRK